MNKKLTLIVLFTIFAVTNTYSQDKFKLPSQNWSLSINLDGFKIESKKFAEDGSAFRLMATNKKKGLTLSLFIEPAEATGDKLVCRDYYWAKSEKSPLAKENVKKFETDTLAIVEHDTKEYNGQQINFHSLNAYLVNAGYWVDVHISKIGYQEADQSVFEKIWKSVAIVAE